MDADEGAPGTDVRMPIHAQSMKTFDTTPRDELEGYARDFGIRDTESMSDTELRKRLRDVQANTGTAPESDGPVVHKGDPGRGPRHRR
jgi:hypothetical protein